MVLCLHMAYTTATEVRDEAGFTENTYIEESVVDRAVVAAESEITGTLAVAGYQLPLTGTVGLVSQIARMLGAGHLLTRDYGTGAEGTSKDGYALKKAARDMLKQVMSHEIILVDADGNPLLQLASNDPTDTAATEYREPIYRMEDQF